MARTWYLIDTLSMGGTLSVGKFIAQDASRSTVYFFASDGHTVYSWNGVLTDISGTFFDGADDQVIDITYFKDNLYVVYTYNASDHLKIARWDGDQDWTDVWTAYSDVEDGAGIYYTPAYRAEWLAADDDRIVLQAAWLLEGGPAVRTKYAASTDGTTWAMQTLSGSDTTECYESCYGRDKGSQYAKVFGQIFNAGGPDPVAVYSSGVNWQVFTALAPSSMFFVGYADGKSFWYPQLDFISTKMQYSTDWGATAIDTTVDRTLGWMTYDLGTNKIMGCKANNNQAYVWNTLSSDFDADGTIASGNILAYFLIGSRLFLLAGALEGEAKIYSDVDGPVVTTDRKLYIYRGTRDAFGNYTFSNKLVET